MTDASGDDGGPSSLATDDGDAGKALAASQGRPEDLENSDAGLEAIKRNPDVDVLAKGIASVLGPVMYDFDGGVEGALKSQSILASSIDRLTRELDKLLEDVPHPYTTHHATRISGIRKRVISLNTALRIIQKRMDMIQRLLAGYASRAAASSNAKKVPLSLMKGSSSTYGYVSLNELPPFESSHRSVNSGGVDKERRSEVEDCEMSEFLSNLSLRDLQEGSPPAHFRLVNKEAKIDQEPDGRGSAIDEAQDVNAQDVVDPEPDGRSDATDEARGVDVEVK